MSNKENELMVKYDNYLNAQRFRGCSAREMDMFMSIITKLRETPSGENVTLSFSLIKKISGISTNSNEDFIDILKSICLKFGSGIEYEDPAMWSVIYLFNLFKINKEEKTLEIKVNPDFEYIVRNLGSNFTIFELGEYESVKSKYSKHLYRLLKQYKSTGKYSISIENLRVRMDCPDSYENKAFIRSVLKPAIKDCSKYFEKLNCKPITADAKGSPVIRVEFTFKKQV